ncbi:MAG: amidohydrolase [Burkholderiales bacterium]|nr:amidohydrolase [Burkholderiales bacterium]
MKNLVKQMVIDIHAHYTPGLLFERFDAQMERATGVKLVRGAAGLALQFPGDGKPRLVMPRLCDLAERRAWMDRNGIDHQLVGGWLESFGYELPSREGLAWSRHINRCMLDALLGEPRFTPLATVPLQDGRFAADVLGEALEQGFGGVMIGTLPRGSGGNLDDPSLDPFWDTASKLGAAVFLHPMTFCGEPRLDDYGLTNALGRLEDTAIAVSRLLFSGHLLRFPGIKVVLSHGGGTLPYALGRLSRSYGNSQGKVADPRQGFATLYFDTCVFDADALEYLARKATPRQLMLGSDMPFPMGDPEPQKVVRNAGFATAEMQAILGGTAQKVFRVRADCWCRS